MPRPVTGICRLSPGHFIPRMRPSFARRPERVVGIPVARENLRFAAVMPSARFQENVRPGPNFMGSPYSLACDPVTSSDAVAAGDGHGGAMRPVTPSDFPALARLMNEINAGTGLLLVHSPEEVAEDLSLPYVDLATDAVCIEEDGEIVGHAHTYFVDSAERELRCYVFGGVHPSARERGIGSRLVAWGVGRARELVAANPHGLPVAIRAETAAGDTASEMLLADNGFVPVRWFNDLHRTLDALPPVREADGFTVAPWDASRHEELRGVKNAAFRDHWGSTPTSAAGWGQMTSGFGARTDLSFMALDAGGRVIGLVLSHRYPGDDEVIGGRYGWIDKVATLADWRGRGVARTLITHTMAAYAREGLTHAALNVDTDNPTGAFGLYSGLGFVPFRGAVNHQLLG